MFRLAISIWTLWKKRVCLKATPRFAAERFLMDDDRDLEFEAARALRGAERLAGILSREMSVGTPSISDIAYAIKLRVKQDYKITEKVKRKREKDPSYDVGRLRDIVGVRIITLYRLDALRIIPILMDKIKFLSGLPPRLFKPGSIEEVKIYSTNPGGDAQSLAGRLSAIFKAYELDAEIVSAPSNYSSIHMIVWCQAPYDREYRDIPVEIQIRTVLEDAWSEIDHALKYKKNSSGQLDVIDVDEIRRLDIMLAHLNVMKTFIDGCSQYADQIKIQIDEIERPRSVPSTSLLYEDPTKAIDRMNDIPENIRTLVRDAIPDLKQAMNPSQPLSDSQIVTALQRARHKLGRAQHEMDTVKNISRSNREAAEYVIGMEQALVLLELGKRVEGGANVLAEAAKIYSNFEEKFPNRGLVKYRYGTVLDALGDRRSAMSKFQDVTDLLRQGTSELPEGHWVRSAAARYISALLWEEAQELQSAMPDNPDQAATQMDRIREIYLEAYKFAREASDVQLDPEIDSAHQPMPPASMRNANNLLLFAVEFLKAGGDESRLRKLGFLQGDLQRQLSEIGAGKISEMTDVDFLDTAFRTFLYVGDKTRAIEAAKRVEAVIEAAAGQGKTFFARSESSALKAARQFLQSGIAPDGDAVHNRHTDREKKP